MYTIFSASEFWNDATPGPVNAAARSRMIQSVPIAGQCLQMLNLPLYWPIKSNKLYYLPKLDKYLTYTMGMPLVMTLNN